MAKLTKPAKEVLETFAVWKDDGVTKHSGLVQADFAATVLVDGAVAIKTVTITEIGATGEYLVRFTPDAAGTWKVEVRYYGAVGVPAQVYETDDVQVYQYDIDDIGANAAAAAQAVPGATELVTFQVRYPGGEPVPNAAFVIRDALGERLHSAFVDATGVTTVPMPVGANYIVSVSRQDLQFDVRSFNVPPGGCTVLITSKTPPLIVIGR